MDEPFRVSYQQERGPLPMSVEDYIVATTNEYMALLSTDPNEPELQEFLNMHPSMVPGAWTPGTPSGHAPLHYALIAEPVLPGLRSRKPDFMWIATDSSFWYPMLIEIEKPRKRVFKKDGVPTAEFTQARNQLAQWRTWFKSPANIQQFIDSYGVPQEWLGRRTMRLHMILIYGRRHEFEDIPELSLQRSSLLSSPDEELVSFDRLAVDRTLSPAITVRAMGHGRYKAIWVPPVFGIHPRQAQRFLHIEGLGEALDQNNMITEERRQFLKERLRYWRGWASSAFSSGSITYGSGSCTE